MIEENHKFLFLPISPLKRRQGKGVFISYCHGEGDAFKELLIKKLTPLIGPGADIFEDDRMEAGDDWKVAVSDWLQIYILTQLNRRCVRGPINSHQDSPQCHLDPYLQPR